ncbi:MAG: endo-1,4-beta-xylanase [Planctomycetota bacterium]
MSRGVNDKNANGRKAEVSLTLLADDGKPIANTEVRFEQTRHDFLFGCALPTWHRGNQEAEEPFKDVFSILFNYLTTETALKWRGLEPRKGQLNWKVVDRIVEWAESKRIAVKGYPLVWGNGPKGSGVPRWLLNKPDKEIARQLYKRVRRVVERYASRMTCWDVINEPFHATWFEDELGSGYMKEALGWVREAAPQAKLLINEYDLVGFDKELARFIKLAKKLQEQGAPLDGIGLQCHPGSRWLRPDEIISACDRIGELGLEVHITELTVPIEKQPVKGRPEGGVWNEETQAEYFDMFFRTAFAHPAVKAITIWGLWDGMVWQNNSGIVRRDFSRKPVFDALDKLINHEWRTTCVLKTDQRGECSFRGYLGQYHVETHAGSRKLTASFHLDGRSETASVALA